MSFNKTYISTGDFIDLFEKLKQKGFKEILSRLHLSDQARTVAKWNTEAASADFWIIPEVRKRWNEKCTGDPDREYEDYVVSKYLSGRQGLRMLSVGAGSGARERKFGKYPAFSSIEGIDIADKQLEEARRSAADLGMDHIKYFAADFTKYQFEQKAYDVILFNSSLHHFDNIPSILTDKVIPLLKEDAYLIIFEYVGPRRLQWTDGQLDFANALLKELPLKYKRRLQSNSIKNKIYRPGLLRMLMIDPSEAIDSESILPALHQKFKVIEEKKIGWDITHILLKDIAHNFLQDDVQTKTLLSYIFEKEDQYLASTERSDAIFGIYQNQ